MRPCSVVLLLVICLRLPRDCSGYYAMVIAKESLCTIPKSNGVLMECEVTAGKEDGRYELIDSNQEESKCRYRATNFTQSCTYNTTYSFTRQCKEYERNCTLLNTLNGGEATCLERYGECVIVSAPLDTRLAVGYPQYNPPICYPGLRAAKNGCNATLSRCEGMVQFEFTSTQSTTTDRLENCWNKCRIEKTRCTNYTKSCNDTTTSWKERYAASVTEEQCDVITTKCVVNRTIEWQGVPDSGRAYRRSAHPAVSPSEGSVLVTRHNCSATRNLSDSVSFCTDSLNNNMAYKAECQLYGVILTRYFFENVYKANATIAAVTRYLTSEWEVIKKLCKEDCFRTITRELRFCINDLPIQNIMPGITHPQLQHFMYRSADLLCASVSEKKVEESCVLYLDRDSDLSKEVVQNMSGPCTTEMTQREQGRTVTCTPRCKNYLLKSVISRDHKPGCCLADLIKFREVTSPWMEMLSPDVFTGNILVHLVQQCSLTENLSSCTESDMMHPAVIFVLAVIGVFSVALAAGVIVFIVVFYRQMEYEGYEKGFLHNIIT